MKWNYLNSTELFESVKEKSLEIPQLIFKHSTACGISATAKRNMEKFYNNSDYDCDIWEVFVIEDREVSQALSYYFNVPHKSPQVLMIYKDQVQWHTSHFRISEKKLNKKLSKIQEVN